jgi:hypothetical protein
MPGTKKDAGREDAALHRHYRIRSSLQLMSKYYNDRGIQDKAKADAVTCRGGEMVFRREGIYGLGALLAALFVFLLLSDPAWSQTTTINETGSGTASTSPTNCQNTGNRECTTTVQGSVIGNPSTNPSTTQGIIGTFTADYDDADVTGSTFTVPAEGEITLTDADGSRLFLSAVGDLSGPVEPAGATLTFDGTFEVTGGTGEFNGATG